MIARLIEWSLRHRFLVGCATVVIVALGIHAVWHTPVDAIRKNGHRWERGESGWRRKFSAGA